MENFFNIQFDVFNQAETPEIMLCKNNYAPMHFLGRVIYNTKLSLRFNGISEFSFTIPESIDGNETTLPVYPDIQSKRLIYIRDIGFFTIIEAHENDSDFVKRKEVSCESLESEMTFKRVSVLEDTCRFFNPDAPYSEDPRENLIGYLLSLVNNRVSYENAGESWFVGWSIGGTIPEVLETRYRTFEVSDTTVYNFLMEEVAKAYNCIFTFDTLTRKIYINTPEDALTDTNIFISHQNLVEAIDVDEFSDEIVTGLHVYGGDELDIRSVNPLGTNVIYNFDYYKTTQWMTSDLITAINTWEQKIEDNRVAYEALIENFLTKNDELYILETEYAILQAEYAAAEVALKAAIESKVVADIKEAKEELEAVDGQVKDKEQEILDKVTEVDNVLANLQLINKKLSPYNLYEYPTGDPKINFTQGQLSNLSKFIFENTYQNENIIALDSFTPADVQREKIDLYAQAQEVLERNSRPKYQFNVSAVNFVQLPEFEPFTSQIPITLGAVIYVETYFGLVPVTLLELQLSFDNPLDFSVTFGNKFRLGNDRYEYADLYGEIAKTSSAVAFKQMAWSNWQEYKTNVVDFISSSLNTSENPIESSENKEIKINAAGLRGRTLVDSSDPSKGYDTQEIWVTGNTIALTKDNWEQAEIVLGTFLVDGEPVIGIPSKYILTVDE